VLNDPEIVKLLSTQFVPLAVDNVANPNLTAGEKEFLGSFDSGVKACTIGMSVFTADGRKLGGGADYQPGPVREMLKKALVAFKPDSVDRTVFAAGKEDAATARKAPEGASILYVTWKVLGDEKPEGSATTGDGKYDKVFQDSLGSDRLWIRKDEGESLAEGSFPESLRIRIARHHLKYVMGGSEKDLQLTLREGRVAGSYPIDPEHRADILGFVEAKKGAIIRFELLIRGWAHRVEDHGFAACLTVVPKGKLAPAVLYLELADPNQGLAKILPHHSKDANYLR
jgi:hypothetical protein